MHKDLKEDIINICRRINACCLVDEYEEGACDYCELSEVCNECAEFSRTIYHTFSIVDK